MYFVQICAYNLQYRVALSGMFVQINILFIDPQKLITYFLICHHDTILKALVNVSGSGTVYIAFFVRIEQGISGVLNEK
jgi:hypothetical protein